jgi:Tol biopolymer transport system component
MKKSRVRRLLPLSLVAAAGAVVSLLVGSTPAPAAFPGANGKIAFTSEGDDGAEIYVMNADGTNQTNLTTNEAYDYSPSWSPDGTKIAFTSDRNENPEIYVMNANGTNQTRLTTNVGEEPWVDAYPSWSPDGTKIAFMSSRDGNDNIYVMNANGTNQTRLTTNWMDDDNPSWSPDGTKIAFTSNLYGPRNTICKEIYVMNANGTNQTRLTTNAADDWGPSWSPDGTKIAFTSSRDGGWLSGEIYVMNADGTNQTRLTTNAASDESQPSWSPDGTKIAFSSNRDGNSNIYVMNANGTNQTRLTTNTAEDAGPSWQRIPDDTTPPNTTITNHPPASTTSTSASFSFGSSESGSSFGCRFDAGAWTPCTSPKAYSGLEHGSHTFQVRAIDAASNVDSTPASYSWTVASGTSGASGKISAAHLTKTSFERSQAVKVKLLYSFSPMSKSFAYLLSVKKKATWLTVRSVNKTGSFKGSYTMTVKRLFGGKAIKVGSYRLKLSADANSKLLTFRVT